MTDPAIIMPLSIKVSINAASSILDASTALITLATNLNCAIHAEFNDVTLMAFPNDSAEGLADDYRLALPRKTNHKIAMDRSGSRSATPKVRVSTWYDTNEPDSLDERGPHD